MESEIGICLDVEPAAIPADIKTRPGLVRAFKWDPGDLIRIAFLNGTPNLKERVARVAAEWCQLANIVFAFGAAADKADVRVSFQGRASWSHLGTDCRSAPKGAPTMNLALEPDSPDDRLLRVVRHEFGHVLGLVHEHQQPDASGIHWEETRVVDYFRGLGLTDPQIRANVLTRYSQGLTAHTRFDPKSIMVYPIPADLTREKIGIDWNLSFSHEDIQFIAEQYPF
ncbi:MAG: hypothetical protein U1A78_25040 [Polyangia bacterium]